MFDAKLPMSLVESNHVTAASRQGRGKGLDAQKQNDLLALPENADIRDYNCDTHPYALEIRPHIKDFRHVTLKKNIEDLEARTSCKCPRDYKRRERFMVKWLYQHKDTLVGLAVGDDSFPWITGDDFDCDEGLVG
jgi:hypothetical protein